MSIEDENPDLQKIVELDNDLKKYIVKYVGEVANPVNGLVTAEMIISILARDIPEVILPLAEENFIRGYKQALIDVDLGKKIYKEQENDRKETN
jgi:hypothetical protein|tara:strand:- start:4155 stop:4436 length:282 start_codon:yes stop_codon:yes gene_type:complete